MKKVFIHISLVIVFIIIYLLQTIFFNHFTIAGIMPNIFIILMLINKQIDGSNDVYLMNVLYYLQSEMLNGLLKVLKL